MYAVYKVSYNLRKLKKSSYYWIVTINSTWLALVCAQERFSWGRLDEDALTLRTGGQPPHGQGKPQVVATTTFKGDVDLTHVFGTLASPQQNLCGNGRGQRNYSYAYRRSRIEGFRNTTNATTVVYNQQNTKI